MEPKQNDDNVQPINKEPAPALTADEANAALAFLQRCDMKPPEINTFVTVSSKLQAIAQASEKP